MRNRYVTLNLENLENTCNFEGWGLTLIAYKKSVSVISVGYDRKKEKIRKISI